MTIATLARPELEIAPPRTRSLIAMITFAAAIYGAAMGAFQPDLQRLGLIVFGAIKMPVLIFTTTAICLPGYFMLNTVLRLRRDFPAAARAVLASQAVMAIALASLAPLTQFAYLCGLSHGDAILFNAAMFTLATAAAQVAITRRYRPLIARDPRHRVTLWSWLVLYAFVGIQMGWMLRPFIGTPGRAVTFLRDEPFSNAYIVIANLIMNR